MPNGFGFRGGWGFGFRGSSPPGLMLAWEGEDSPDAGISWELCRQLTHRGCRQGKRHILTMAEPGRHPLMRGQPLLQGRHPSLPR